jgi:hypothetical protein
LRKLVVLGVIVVVLAVVADLGLRALAENQVEAAAEREAPGAYANASIPAFPFLPPLLLAGNVATVQVHLVQVKAQAVVFDSIDFDLHGVEISRHALFNDRRVELVKIDRGTVTAVVQLPAVVRQLPVNGITARVVGRSIVLRGPRGVSVSLPMPAASLVPCQGTATVEGSIVRISCTLEEIPPALINAVNRAA